MGNVYDLLATLVEREDPNLVTPLVRTRLEDFRDFENIGAVKEYDTQTKRRIEGQGFGDQEKIKSSRLLSSYSRRLLAAIYFGDMGDESGFFSASMGSGRAAKAASVLFERNGSIPLWLYRAMVLKRRSADFGAKNAASQIGDAFISYVVAAKRAVKLHKGIREGLFKLEDLGGVSPEFIAEVATESTYVAVGLTSRFNCPNIKWIKQLRASKDYVDALKG